MIKIPDQARVIPEVHYAGLFALSDHPKRLSNADDPLEILDEVLNHLQCAKGGRPHVFGEQKSKMGASKWLSAHVFV